jgi:hypothetical protein
MYLLPFHPETIICWVKRVNSSCFQDGSWAVSAAGAGGSALGSSSLVIFLSSSSSSSFSVLLRKLHAPSHGQTFLLPLVHNPARTPFHAAPTKTSPIHQIGRHTPSNTNSTLFDSLQAPQNPQNMKDKPTPDPTPTPSTPAPSQHSVQHQPGHVTIPYCEVYHKGWVRFATQLSLADQECSNKAVGWVVC